MPYGGNGWVDWAAAERDQDSPIDTVFLDKWWRRDALRLARPIRPIQEAGTRTIPNSWADWMPVRGPEGSQHDRIFVPPWATHLYVNVSQVLGLTDPSSVQGGIFQLRAHVGSAISSVMTVRLGCITHLDPDTGEPFCVGPCSSCDGMPSASGTAFRKEAIVELVEADRGQEVDFYWQADKGSSPNVASGSIALPYPWLWTCEED